MHHSISDSAKFLLIAALTIVCETRPASAAEPADPAAPSPPASQPADAATPPASAAQDSADLSVVPSATTVAPSTAPTLTPTPTPSGDSDFYGAEGSTTEASDTATYPKLDLSGFADFTFAANLAKKSSPLRNAIQPHPSFSVGNLNLYLSAALAPKWRFLGEVRFLYLPQGNLVPTPTGASAPYDASAADYADDGNTLTWGGVQIQRAQIDYTFHQLLSFRVGQFLTPVGIWNVDHGSPTVIGVYRPYIIGRGMFPERQTGLQVYGEWSTGAHALGYAVTLSNGRGPSDAYSDLDNNKALGGRIAYTNSSFGSLTVGLSGYDGTYASGIRQYSFVASPNPTLITTNALTVRYHERSLGADVRFQWQGLLVQGEGMLHAVVYEDQYRAIANGALQADYNEKGFYALAGYRTPWLGTMPFLRVEALNFASSPLTAPGYSWIAGLNIRPEPSVVLKLEYFESHIGSDTSQQLIHGVVNRVLAQVAVAF